MEKFNNEREAFLFGQQQLSLIPEQFRQAFLKGAHDRAVMLKQQNPNFLFLDPEVEEAYKKLLAAYKTKTAIAKAIGMPQGNLHSYLSGRLPIGPKVKSRILVAAAAIR